MGDNVDNYRNKKNHIYIYIYVTNLPPQRPEFPKIEVTNYYCIIIIVIVIIIRGRDEDFYFTCLYIIRLDLTASRIRYVRERDD
jgi:hypothetical protein